MSKIALAGAVALASLFAAGAPAPADAHGFKRDKPHTVHHYRAKRKAKAAYKVRKRVRAMHRLRHRKALKLQHRRTKRSHYVRRYR